MTRPSRHSLFAAICLLLLGAASPPSWAWGPDGHRVVALLAEDRLDADVRRQLDALLAREPGTRLADLATWADETRSDATFKWHFVNFPRGDCSYQPQRDCPGGDCVIAALNTQAQRLANRSLPAEERLEALKYLVHFTADIHQPLHAAFGDDLGGNRYQLSIAGEGSNLHALWDSGLLRLQGVELGPWLKALKARPLPAIASTDRPQDWALESCAIASRPGFYPPHKLPADYPQQWQPVLEDRIVIASLRLESLLTKALTAPSSR